MAYSSHFSKAVVPVLVLLFDALWFILRGDLLYVLPCAFLFLCFSVLLALRLPRLGKRELILMLFVCLIDLCFFRFVCFLFLLMSGKGCGLWLWHSLDLSLTFFGRKHRGLFDFYCRSKIAKIVPIGNSRWLFPLPLDVWEGLRFVIMALSGPFSYLFW